MLLTLEDGRRMPQSGLYWTKAFRRAEGQLCGLEARGFVDEEVSSLNQAEGEWSTGAASDWLSGADEIQWETLFGGLWQGRRVLVTGHTGFKGTWLALWLARMGAQVQGLALDPISRPSHWSLLKLPVDEAIGDLRDPDFVSDSVQRFKPEVVFHLGAQALADQGFHQPADTMATNVIGTVNLFEALRDSPGLRVIVVATSDKCYDNQDWAWSYRESDPLGGTDPFSASKACVEIVAHAWRRAYFENQPLGRRPILLATARAGNAIGGGDWTPGRLIPDLMRAASNHEIASIRRPDALRSWQHVLDPLAGYLLLAQRLWFSDHRCAKAWNFAPADPTRIPVGELVAMMSEHWPALRTQVDPLAFAPDRPPVTLDSQMARNQLGWQPIWSVGTSVAATVQWYRLFYEARRLASESQLAQYVAAGAALGQTWASNALKTTLVQLAD